ncbi:MAG TPA: S-layer homology domain-containing protein [Chloroflexia bacterium]|nr:S-layer homology domain-containing protein [Chloroflexia bacterium]
MSAVWSHARRLFFVGLLLLAASLVWGGASNTGIAPAAAGPANYTPSPSRTPGTPSPSRTPGSPTAVPNSPTPRPSATPSVCPAGPHWDVVDSPNASGTSSLYGVAFAAADDGWAAGLYYDGVSVLHPMMQHWDGANWAIVPLPELDGALLQGVAVIAPDDVWAVGAQDGYYATLTMHWDGTDWSVVPSPSFGTSYNRLFSVAGTASNDVWAVGQANGELLVLHWNGTAWSRTALPAGPEEPRAGAAQSPPSDSPTTAYGTGLYGVTALAANDVWAVGAVAWGSAVTVTYHWDGSNWTHVTSPNIDGSQTYLQGVAAVSANNVWAVGYATGGTAQAVAMHWDGAGWSLNNPQSMNPDTAGRYLYAVAASASGDVWAAGRNNEINSATTLALRWNGSSWTEVPTVSPSIPSSLFAVTVQGPIDAWAVGSYGYYRTLVERYPGAPCPTGTPATATSTPTVNPQATPTCRPGGPITLSGSISTSDPVQTGRLDRTLPASTCGDPGGCATVAGSYHYDLYGPYTNTTANTVCVTVTLTTNCIDSHYIYSSAYLGAFNPANICANFVGDPGTSPNGPPVTYSFEVLAGQSFYVNVSEVTADQGCAAYTVVVAGLPGEICGSPTATPPASNTPGAGPSSTTVPATSTAVSATSTAVPPSNTPGPSSTPGPSNTPGSGPTNTPGPACQFAILSFESCIDDQGCVTYEIPLQNTGSQAVTLNGTVIFESRNGVEIGRATIPDTVVAAEGTTIVTGTVCGVVDPEDGPFQLFVTVQDVQRVCDSKEKRQPVMFCDMTMTPRTFTDVPPEQPFADYVGWMAGYRFISGYNCGGPGEPCNAANDPYFRPGLGVTRGQMLKMVVGTSMWTIAPPATNTFADVPRDNPFYGYIETGAALGFISGYNCGGPGEPCDGINRPYFRPGAPVTRSQLSKIINGAWGFNLPLPASPTFADVGPTSPFYPYVEAMAHYGIVGGYTCGGAGEPCDAAHRPYFRPGLAATRGQVTKFITMTYRGP